MFRAPDVPPRDVVKTPYRWLWGAILLHSTLSVAANAQRVEAYSRYIDSLEQERIVVLAALEEMARDADRAGADTLHLGNLTIVAPREHREAVRVASRRAWDAIRAELRSDTALLNGAVLYLPGSGMRRVVASGLTRVIRWSGTLEDTVQLSAELVLTSGEAILRLLDQETREWIGGVSPLYQAANAIMQYQGNPDLTWTYVELASSQSQVGRDCFEAQIGACRLALGIDPANDPLTQWYDAADHRALVERMWARTQPDKALRHQCLDNASDSACREFLSQLDKHQIPPPLSLLPRRGLAQLALQLGGEGAFGRLVSSVGSKLDTRLEMVSGHATDTLISEWHAAVMAAAPERASIDYRTTATGVLWILVFSYAATRSSRWRLG